MTSSPTDTGQDIAPARYPAHVISSDAEAIQVARAFAEHAAKDAALRDRKRLLPWAELERFTASGLGSISIPKVYGGPGVSNATIAEVFRIICTADPALGQIPQNHFGVISVLIHAADEDQKRRLFQSVLDGARIGNAGPERGTRHTLEINARAIRKGDGSYRVSGAKFYSTGALFAHWITAKAVDDDGNVVMAFIPRGTSGLRIIDDWSGIGQRTTASGTVLLNDVPVAAENIVQSGQLAGRPSLQGSFSQLIQAAIDAGIAHAAVADTIDFVRQRSRPWADAAVNEARLEPYIIAEVGKLKLELHAAEALLDRAARTLDAINAGPLDDDAAARASIAVAEAKVLTTEIALLASEKLFELAGSRATLAEFNLDRHWRNARTHTLHDPVRWKVHAVGHYHLNGVRPARHSWI
ncbi:SfnB family sulfur acquisition oxidoreductase [Pseudomonas matsuisoli]|uniref:SfnB family sulfur acquisition oxidoreductase n=1 Tax=Pseudomonas matsuisoli TaxID=1515666 RepID=A0A917PVJ0_9PSED|nr:SfnB family sulfur acquisition oxidoreductase [Pseudomonas matsuisoli]